jgi:hypothetical protein
VLVSLGGALLLFCIGAATPSEPSFAAATYRNVDQSVPIHASTDQDGRPVRIDNLEEAEAAYERFRSGGNRRHHGASLQRSRA